MAEKKVGVSDEHQIDGRPAVARDAEYPFVKRGKLSVAASGAFRKDKKDASVRQMLFNRLQIIDHRRSHHFIRRGRNIAGAFQKPAENGNLKKSIFDDGYLPRVNGNQQNRVKVR